MTKKKNDVEPNGAVIPEVVKPLPAIPEESVSEGKAAVTTFTDRAQAFMIMDERDSGLIVDTLLGQFSEEYIYDIAFKTPKGRCNCKAADGPHNHARGLSVTGVREGCRNMKGIQCQQIGEPTLIKEKGVEYYVACAEATDLISGLSERKYYRVPLLKTRKDGGTYDDPYAYQIAQSKAERNAKSVLLPQEVVKAWIQDYLSGAKQLNPARAEEYRNKEKQKALSPPSSKSEPNGNRDQAIATILEKLKNCGVDDKHQDRLLCKIAEHLGHEPIPKKLKDIDSKKLPVILQWLFQVNKQMKLDKPTGNEVELNDFSSLLGETIKGK